jgi:N6-L-threonylcarbamoyladenine synthase
MYILGIETSCDETSVAILNDNKILSNIISSQQFHSKYGGVVPEIASREHLKSLPEITKSALSKAKIEINEIDVIACTSEPGLVGALLIGLNFSKSMAFSLNKPFVPVNHIQAHLYSSFLNHKKPKFPFISLIVSGGHTLLILVKDYFSHTILGTTQDDAAGEAFDKAAKMMDLGYPGGPIIDKLSAKGNTKYHKFPVSVIKSNYFDFSFSGIKTSVLYHLKKINFEEIKNEKLISDICASFQEAIVNTLFEKTLKAAKRYDIKNIAISGGVSANSVLKDKFRSLEQRDFRIFIPDPLLSTDNAAMIAFVGYLKYIHDDPGFRYTENLKRKAHPRLDKELF